MNITRIPRKDDLVRLNRTCGQLYRVTKVRERPASVTVWMDVVREPGFVGAPSLEVGRKLDSFSPRDILAMLHQP